MHASPGCMRDEPSLPPVQYTPLVHVGAAPSGSLPLHVPGGIEASTHAWKVAMSAAATGAAGAGGIGIVVLVMRTSARCATSTPPTPGAIKSAYVVSDIGAALLGGLPWQLVQWSSRMPWMSHGRSPDPDPPPPPPP